MRQDSAGDEVAGNVDAGACYVEEAINAHDDFSRLISATLDDGQLFRSR